jgi:hypothetical protein
MHILILFEVLVVDLVCEFLGDRVKITGKTITYLIGEIEI